MNIPLYIGILAAGTAILLVSLVFGFWTMMALQRPISLDADDSEQHSESGKRGLVVIDMQEDFTRKGVKTDSAQDRMEQCIREVNLAVAWARDQGVPVIFVRQIFRGMIPNLMVRLFAAGAGSETSEGLGLDPRIDVQDAPVIEKSRGDAFSSSAFCNWLDANDIGALRLAGLDRQYCLRASALGGLARGLTVEWVEEATYTATPRSWPTLRQTLADRGVAFV